MSSYFDQFNVISLVGSLVTNVSLTLVVCGLMALILLPSGKIVPTSMDTVWLSLVSHWSGLIIDNVGKSGLSFLPGLFGLFILLLVLNLVGFFPYTYTVTAQIVMTFSLSFTMVLSVTLEGIIKFSSMFFSMWMPMGAPMGLAPLLVLMETVSYFSSALSLGLSLAANLSAGHLLMIILGSFTFQLASAKVLSLTSIALGITLFVMILEMAVAAIQAYVFCLLTAVYLSDTAHLH